MSKEPPLCVDLDGTLLRTDLLLEGVAVLIRQRPSFLFLLPFWLLKGKANLKAEVASRIDFSDALFPVNEEVVEFVRAAKGSRERVLVTGIHQRFADSITN